MNLVTNFEKAAIVFVMYGNFVTFGDSSQQIFWEKTSKILLLKLHFDFHCHEVV